MKKRLPYNIIADITKSLNESGHTISRSTVRDILNKQEAARYSSETNMVVNIARVKWLTKREKQLNKLNTILKKLSWKT